MIAARIGCTAEMLRHWVRQAERDHGLRPGPTTEEHERIKQLERENRELRQANEILRKASRSAQTDFVLDALEQALYARHPATDHGLVHHSDHGVQYVSVRYAECLQEAGIGPSVGSVGDSYALAETINGLYKAEVIHRQSWKNLGR